MNKKAVTKKILVTAFNNMLFSFMLYLLHHNQYFYSQNLEIIEYNSFFRYVHSLVFVATIH